MVVDHECSEYMVIISYISAIIHYDFFFFKQKTAYELRISDWSSDLCSSDLAVRTAAWPSCFSTWIASRTSTIRLAMPLATAFRRPSLRDCWPPPGPMTRLHA